MSQQLEDYNYQLSQVNTALEKDSENEELLQLKKDLEQLLELLQEESQLLEAAATETASAPVKKDSAQKSIDLELLEGDMVLGKWSDGQYYECMVVGQAEGAPGSYEVAFSGYESIQVLNSSQLRKPKQNEKMPTLLTSKEVQIGEIKSSKSKHSSYKNKPSASGNSSIGGGGGPMGNNSKPAGSRVEKKSKKNSKRDESDQKRVNSWQTFAASKGVMKKGVFGGGLTKEKTFTSTSSKGKHAFGRE